MNNIEQYEKFIHFEEKHFPLELHKRHTKNTLHTHWHEHMELLYFTAGNCRVNCAGKFYNAQVNDLIVVNNNEIHYFEKSESGRYSCIIIDPVFFADVNMKNITIQSFIRNDKIVNKCFEKLFLEYNSKTEGYDMEIKSIVYHLISYLLRNYKLENLNTYELDMRKKQLERTNQILDYISTHYHNKLTTSELAKQFFLNEHYFCHFFKKMTGESPMNYINKYRIEKAQVLLKNADSSITEIAINVGFEDINYFSRTFKKYVGIPPKQYRNSTQNRKDELL